MQSQRGRRLPAVLEANLGDHTAGVAFSEANRNHSSHARMTELVSPNAWRNSFVASSQLAARGRMTPPER